MTDSLVRSVHGRAAAPVRIAHLGTGNFFRAHQAWYTEHAPDAADWGIAAFSGHGGGTAARLAEQDGLYTLVVRGADGDQTEVVSALSRVATELDDWRRVFAAPELALVTMTITEAGYRRRSDGGLDLDEPEVVADIAALRRAGPTTGPPTEDHQTRDMGCMSSPDVPSAVIMPTVTTAPGKLVLGLAVRRARGLPAPALVSCDNVPGNGEMVRRVVGELAAAVDRELAAWIAEHVSFVTTMVDRITPRATDDDRAALRAATGVDDPVPVITEPYTEWVLAGEFPLGRPRWEDVGARFVEDVEPWERRKLWLLNGSHSLMAYAGSVRGHTTVQEAISDPVVREWVDQWWDDAARHLPLPAEEISAYRAALLERYANPRIRHLLAQIAADGSQKLPIRILPVVRAELAEGRVPTGAARVLAAWIAHLRGAGAPVADVGAEEFTALAAGELQDAVHRVLERLGVADGQLDAAVLTAARELDG